MQPTTTKQILIVEDDARLRSILGRGLRRHGFRVHTAETLSAARELLGSEPVDIAVVDIGLPDGSGWDLIGWARARIDADLRIIVISADRPVEPPHPDAAPDAVLEKPFSVDALVHQVGLPREGTFQKARTISGRRST